MPPKKQPEKGGKGGASAKSGGKSGGDAKGKVMFVKTFQCNKIDYKHLSL